MDYIDIAMGATYALPSEIDRYVERTSRFLPIRIISNNKKYELFGASRNNSHLILPAIAQTDATNNINPPSTQIETNKPLTASDCVVLCQNVLGLKINEIAKLVNVSRATLDLHRKGANVKDMNEYQRVYDFVAAIEAQYKSVIKNGVRNVLIQRKTLLQHFMLNKNNLENTYPYIKEVAEKLGNVNIVQTEINRSKANLRLSGIGRMA